jgi:hypothetical protein
VPILRDLARQHEHVAGFEARLILRDHEAGSLNLDWVPKPNRRPRSPRRVSATRPTTAQLDAVEAVHATTMSGGFLNSLVVSGPAFADAIAGYEALGLAEAAGLVRQALSALPGAAVPDDHDRRAALIDGLGKDDGAMLDRLSDEYQELFPSDDILLDVIEAARGS